MDEFENESARQDEAPVTETVVEESAVPPAPMSVDEETPAPAPTNRTGLFILVAAIIILALAFILAGPLFFQAAKKTGAVKTPVERVKMETAIGFMKAMLNNDTLGIKPYLTDEAQNAITSAEWQSIAAAAETGTVEFGDPAWTGDTKAVLTFRNVEVTGTVTFSYDAKVPTKVVMDGLSLQGTAHDTVDLVAAGKGWRVTGIDNGKGEVIAFDGAFVKSMLP